MSVFDEQIGHRTGLINFLNDDGTIDEGVTAQPVLEISTRLCEEREERKDVVAQWATNT